MAIEVTTILEIGLDGWEEERKTTEEAEAVYCPYCGALID